MKWVLFLLTVGLVIVHQDLWNWATAQPLLFGYLPVGLWYHALFCVAASILLAMYVHFAWPAHLEDAAPETPEARSAEGRTGH